MCVALLTENIVTKQLQKKAESKLKMRVAKGNNGKKKQPKSKKKKTLEEPRPKKPSSPGRHWIEKQKHKSKVNRGQDFTVNVED